MGRPPIGKIAMTAAERKLRWREKHRGTKPGTKPEGTVSGTKPAPGEADALRRENADLRKQVAALTKERDQAKARAAPQDDAALREQIATLTRERDDARANRFPWDVMRAQKQSIDRLTKELKASRAATGLDAGVEATIAKLKAGREAAEAKLAKAEARLADDPGENAKLLRALKAASSRARYAEAERDAAERAAQARGALLKSDHRKLMKFFHPDKANHVPNEKERTEAMQIVLKLRVIGGA